MGEKERGKSVAVGDAVHKRLTLYKAENGFRTMNAAVKKLLEQAGA